MFELDDSRVVPSVEMEDGLDYVPADSKYLADQHFSIIAAAGPVTGPVTGPIIAGITFVRGAEGFSGRCERQGFGR